MSGAKSCLPDLSGGEDEMKISLLPLHFIWRGFLLLKLILNLPPFASLAHKMSGFQDIDHIGFYNIKKRCRNKFGIKKNI